MLNGGGHRASRTRRSAVKAHTHRADWLGRVAEEQPKREQCRTAAALERHARGDRPSRHTRTVPTGSAGRLKSSTSASNAVRRRPSSVTHEALGRQGTHAPCRLARPSG